jgi:hypothetical protein
VQIADDIISQMFLLPDARWRLRGVDALTQRFTTRFQILFFGRAYIPEKRGWRDSAK